MKFRGCITFSFDDGYDDVHRLVLPILEKNGFSGVFAIPLSSASLAQETRQKMRPWQDWVSISKAGHELAAHSMSHSDLTKLLPQDLEKELQQPALSLSATTLVYPGGAHNDTVIAASKKFYTAARTVQSGFNILPPLNPWKLYSYNFSKNNFSLYKANLLALWAWCTNSWLIETYHLVTTTESNLLHSTLVSDFEKHVAFVKRLPIAVKTIKDVISY